MTTAMDVADEIITIASNEGNPVSNLKLQKIMYFLNALSLVKRNKPLIDDAKFEKWDYGPVIHYVYSEYSFNGASPILKPSNHQVIVFDDNNFPKLENNSFDQKKFEENDSNANFIIKNINVFLKFSASKLVAESHKEPQWINRFSSYDDFLSLTPYDDNLIKEFYSNPINQFWR